MSLPFPTFEVATARHEAYGGLVVLCVKAQTFGSAMLQSRLSEAFEQVAPDAPKYTRIARAALVAQTVDILVDAEAAANNPGFSAIAAFWAWRKSATNDELVEAAAQVWDWFVNVAPWEFVYKHWDEAVGKASISVYAAPKELKPVLTEAEKADPN